MCGFLMSEQPSLEAALNKFENAMSTFEGAAVRVKQQLSASNVATGEAHAMREDRSRLAAELDRTKAKLSDQARINTAAVQRLDEALAAMSRIVDSGDGQ